MVLVGDVTKRIAILVDDMAGRNILKAENEFDLFCFRYMWNI